MSGRYSYTSKVPNVIFVLRKPMKNPIKFLICLKQHITFLYIFIKHILLPIFRYQFVYYLNQIFSHNLSTVAMRKGCREVIVSQLSWCGMWVE